MAKQANIFSFFSSNQPTPTCVPLLEAKKSLILCCYQWGQMLKIIIKEKIGVRPQHNY